MPTPAHRHEPRTARGRRTAALAPALGALALVAVGCRGPGPNRVPSADEPTGTVRLAVDGFASDAGQALINVFLGPDGFPNDPRRAWRALEVPVVGGRVEQVLEAVPAGPLAVSVFHDEDADFELDTNAFGIPSEAWGVSRGASNLFGPPAYEDAELTLGAGETLELTITVD